MLEAGLSSVSEENLCDILLFVGKGNHRYVAGVNRRFQSCYKQLFEDTTTKRSQVVASIPRVQLALQEDPHLAALLCDHAAANGNLIVLRWARENGYEWTDQTCSKAAEKGHLQVIQWAHAHGCPWGEAASVALANGKFEILEWAASVGFRMSVGSLDMCMWALFMR